MRSQIQEFIANNLVDDEDIKSVEAQFPGLTIPRDTAQPAKDIAIFHFNSYGAGSEGLNNLLGSLEYVSKMIGTEKVEPVIVLTGPNLMQAEEQLERLLNAIETSYIPLPVRKIYSFFTITPYSVERDFRSFLDHDCKTGGTVLSYAYQNTKIICNIGAPFGTNRVNPNAIRVDLTEPISPSYVLGEIRKMSMRESLDNSVGV